MAPGAVPAAARIAEPRSAVMRRPSAKLIAPAATRAEYSPSEWPITSPGSRPASAATRKAATEAVSSAGWQTSVAVSRSMGPSKHSCETGQPSTSSASSKVRRAPSWAAARARPMPTAWAPCPGNIATIMRAPPPRGARSGRRWTPS
jgi:hypothetical protein